MVRRIALVMLFALITGVLVSAPATAQSSQPTTIPIFSTQFTMRLSPDGNTLAAFEVSAIHNDDPAPEFLPIHLIDLKAGKEAMALGGFRDYASDVAFTPDGSRLASYHGNGFIYVWDVKTGKPLNTIGALPLPHRIKFLADGKTLLVWQSGTTPLFLWDTESGNITSVIAPRPDSQKEYKAKYLGSPPNWLAFADSSPDGKLIATMTVLGDISLWDSQSGRETPVGEPAAPEAKNMLMKSSLSFSTDGKLLLYGDNNAKAIQVVDVATRKQIASVAVKFVPIAKFFDLAADGDTLAWVENDKGAVTVHRWSISKNASLGDNSFKAAYTSGLLMLDFTPDGRQLLLGGFAALSDFKNAVYVINVPK